MSEQQLCPQCGGEIPSGAPAGLCPKCLVLAGLESRPVADPGTAATQPPPSSASTGFVPPTVEEVAARFPQLEVLELLGRGGMGAVYKARQRELDRLVAVKILPPEVSRDPAFAERFTREARALARLNHPKIVAVYDFGSTADGQFYFVMEYVDGVNLRQAILSGGMDPKQALAIVPQICDALQFAHDEGVVHRDIKPENILIDKRGRVKIADFGLAKLLGQESVDHGLTATQQVMGTLRYMAPEQMEGTKTVDHRADIYSLGVVFYELLTGELPIGRFAPPSKMVEIDVRLDEVVLRALEKKPEQRYQHASEVKTDMESITGSPVQAPAAESVGTLSGPTLLLDETDRAARRTQHVMMLGGMAWIVLGVFIVLLKLPMLLPISILLWIGGIAFLVMAGRIRQQWEIDYLGHSVRFENSVYTSGRLSIDGKTMAAGGVKWLNTEIGARVPRGAGAGDRIFVKTNPDFLSFRCRIFVEPKAAVAAVAAKPTTAPESGHLANRPAGPTKARMVLLLGLGAISAVAVLAAEWFWLYRPWPKWPTALETRIIGNWAGQGETFSRAKVGQEWQSWTQFKESVSATFKSDGTYSWWQQSEFLSGNTLSSKTTLSLPKLGDPPAHWKVVAVEGSKLYIKLDDGPHVMEGGFEFHGEDEFTMKLPESDQAKCGYTFHRSPQPESAAESFVHGAVIVLSVFVLILSVGTMLYAFFNLFLMPSNRRPRGGYATSETPPPRPHEGIAMANGPNKVSPIGRISLWMAIGGLVVPILLAVVGAVLAADERYGPFLEVCFKVCLVLLFLLELAALVCGIVGWRTASGKAGVAVSVISLVLVSCVGVVVTALIIWNSGMDTKVPAKTKTTSATARTTPPAYPSNVESPVQPKITSAPATPPAQNAPAGKQAPPTPAELARILAELPKEFTKGLQGSDVEKIRELDTLVRAIDFDDGPADFWMQSYDRSFPERLPSRNEWDGWHIPKAKAHILMWIQPRQSVGMNDRLRGALAAMPPGCSLGIDVDGKPAARINYDVPKSVPKMQPLWFDWDSVDMPLPDTDFVLKLQGKAICFIVRQTREGETVFHACQLALVYRRTTSAENPKGNQP